VRSAVYRQVHAALLQALPAAQREGAQVQIGFGAARGAAHQPCPGGWEMGPLNFRHLARVTVPLRCESQRGSVVAQVQARAPVWTLRADVPAGRALRAEDLQLQLRELTQLEALLPESALLGMQLRADGRSGQMLEPRDIARPVVVRRGDKVEIRAQDDGVQVSVAGIATGSGKLGETAVVRNARSGRPVKGTLIAPGCCWRAARRPRRRRSGHCGIWRLMRTSFCAYCGSVA
jgi:flagella basal body P-ring formation protein FlgA